MLNMYWLWCRCVVANLQMVLGAMLVQRLEWVKSFGYSWEWGFSFHCPLLSKRVSLILFRETHLNLRQMRLGL